MREDYKVVSLKI